MKDNKVKIDKQFIGQKVIDKMILMFLVFLTIIIGVILVIEIYPFKVVEFHSPYQVLTPVVKAGQNLRYQRNSEKFIRGEANMSCSFTNEIIYSLPLKVSNNLVGNYNGPVEVTVPENLPPSTYVYGCVLTYKLFGIRELRYEFFTTPFQVIK